MEFNLIGSKRPVIALSGGLDSVALLSVINDLHLQGFVRRPRAVTVDHGTRADISHELAGLKDFCLKLGIEYTILKIAPLDLKASNFENLARHARYQALKENLEKDEVCLLGHHLDDCFEWSLMQQFKSSQMSSKLGIPVKRGIFRRPLHCVSRAQILKYARLKNLSWFEDSSNKNLKFERNFVRENLVKKIAKRYPKYLKHYVNSQRELKLMLQSNNAHKKMMVKYRHREWGVILEVEGDLQPDLLKREIFKISSATRGQVSLQIDKFVQNFNKNTNETKGPYTFSGGIEVYQFGRAIIIVAKNFEIEPIASQIPGAFPFIVKAKPKEALRGTSIFLSAKCRELQEQMDVSYPWKSPRGQVLIYI
ncbi:tRNA(Ile)-lysidine synthetase [Bacteriovorax sp. Seq25_V]|nr:tRNA(Ile)-lysidine synthetase [Bacteriovorax sp. Seq25_V]